MFYKINNITKDVILITCFLFLLSMTVYAQNTLELVEDDDEFPSSQSSGPSSEDSYSANDGQSQEESVSIANENGNTSSSEESNSYSSDSEKQRANEDSGYQSSNGFENNRSQNINTFNNYSGESDRQAFIPQNNSDEFSNKIMDQVREDLFSQMADIEKQTSLLTLELKREKVKNEIASMHAQRQKAIEEEKERKLDRERKQAEWEKEQERKLLEEQQKVKALEIKYEKLRQERVLKAYKDNMLKTNQDWINYNTRLFNQLVKEEKARNELITKEKEYFKNLKGLIAGITTAAQQTREKYNKEIANLQTQVAILKSKLEAERAAAEDSKKKAANPFAMAEADNSPKKKIAEEYAIMEISGKGDVLVAKLINKSGGTFMVKPGTILNTGHVIEEITQTYITADKNGTKDYLYFSAGGILDKEPSEAAKRFVPTSGISEENSEEMSSPRLNRLPNLREGMFVN